MTTIDLNTLINTAHIGIINKDPYVLSIVIGIVVLFITTGNFINLFQIIGRTKEFSACSDFDVQ